METIYTEMLANVNKLIDTGFTQGGGMGGVERLRVNRCGNEDETGKQMEIIDPPESYVSGFAELTERYRPVPYTGEDDQAGVVLLTVAVDVDCNTIHEAVATEMTDGGGWPASDCRFRVALTEYESEMAIEQVQEEA